MGTWDLPVNGNMSLLDTILGAVTSISTTGGTTALNSSQLANGTITVSGNLTSDAVLLFPAVQGWWSIENLCSNAATFGLFVVSGTATIAIGMPPGEVTDIQINGGSPKYRGLGRVGSYLDLAVATVPPWIARSTPVLPYLVCDGSSFNPSNYSQLNAVLGTNVLPDFRGRGSYFLNSGTGRLTSGGSGIDGNTIYAVGNNDGISLVSTQIPSLNGSNNISVSIVGGGLNNGSIAACLPGFGITGLNTGPQGAPTGNFVPVAATGGWGAVSSLSGNNNIIVNSGGASAKVPSTTPGVVAGIRMIRAA